MKKIEWKELGRLTVLSFVGGMVLATFLIDVNANKVSKQYAKTLPNYADSLARLDVANADSVIVWTDAVLNAKNDAKRDVAAKNLGVYNAQRTEYLAKQYAQRKLVEQFRDSVKWAALGMSVKMK